MNPLVTALIGLSWGLLSVVLIRLVSPPRLDVALRLGPRLTATTKTVIRDNARVLRMAIQNQQYADLTGLKLELRVVGGSIRVDEMWGFLGLASDVEGVTVVCEAGGGGASVVTLDIARLRALKTMIFEFGCTDQAVLIVGTLAAPRTSLGDVFVAGLPGPNLGTHTIEFSASWRDDRTLKGPQRVHAWGERFPRRPSQDRRVLVTALGLAATTFVLLSELVGVRDMWTATSRTPTLIVLGVLLALTTVVWQFVKPKQKPIAQGFFEPTQLKPKTSTQPQAG